MTDKSAREIIAERLCRWEDQFEWKHQPSYYQEADFTLAALEAGGFAVVPKEPTEAMRIAASACDWHAWDGETPRYIVRYRAMLAASNPKEEGK